MGRSKTTYSFVTGKVTKNGYKNFFSFVMLSSFIVTVSTIIVICYLENVNDAVR